MTWSFCRFRTGNHQLRQRLPRTCCSCRCGRKHQATSNRNRKISQGPLFLGIKSGNLFHHDLWFDLRPALLWPLRCRQDTRNRWNDVMLSPCWFAWWSSEVLGLGIPTTGFWWWRLGQHIYFALHLPSFLKQYGYLSNIIIYYILFYIVILIWYYYIWLSHIVWGWFRWVCDTIQ